MQPLANSMFQEVDSVLIMAPNASLDDCVGWKRRTASPMLRHCCRGWLNLQRRRDRRSARP